MPLNPWDEWCALTMEQREAILEQHGVVSSEHPSRKWWRHPIEAVRMAQHRWALASKVSREAERR